MTERFIFFGDGIYSEYIHHDRKVTEDKKIFDIFYIPLPVIAAKKFNLTGSGKRGLIGWNYDAKAEIICASYPSNLEGRKRVWCLKHQPDVTIYFIEYSFDGQQTPFCQRREHILEEIMQKRELLQQLVIIKKQREEAYYRSFDSIKKEVEKRTDLVKIPYNQRYGPPQM